MPQEEPNPLCGGQFVESCGKCCSRQLSIILGMGWGSDEVRQCRGHAGNQVARPVHRWLPRSARKSGVIVMAERFGPLPRNLLCLNWRTGWARSPRKSASPGQSLPLHALHIQYMPAALFLQEANPDWSLHSNRSQVTGKIDARLRLALLSFGRGGITTVARVSPRDDMVEARNIAQNPVAAWTACRLHLQIPIDVCGTSLVAEGSGCLKGPSSSGGGPCRNCQNGASRKAKS